MAETMMIPWYATGFRSDELEADLNEIAAVAMQYGATYYAVWRSKDDRYKFQQYVTFESHADWERYWEGADMIEFRALHSSWYQVPVLYSPWVETTYGRLGETGNGGRGPLGERTQDADDGAEANGPLHADPRVRAV